MTNSYHSMATDSDLLEEGDMPTLEDRQKIRKLFFEDRVAALAASKFHIIPSIVESPPQGEGEEERGPSGQKGSSSMRIDEPGPSNVRAGNEEEISWIAILCPKEGILATEGEEAMVISNASTS